MSPLSSVDECSSIIPSSFLLLGGHCIELFFLGVIIWVGILLVLKGWIPIYGFRLVYILWSRDFGCGICF
jgi:hypothetical protein